MSAPGSYLTHLLERLRRLREKAGLSEAQVEERLILGPGWIRRFERGETIPSVDVLVAIAHVVGAAPGELFQGLPAPEAAKIERHIFAERHGDDLAIHFKYASFDATYLLNGATTEEFADVILELRNGLAKLSSASDAQQESIKTEAVARCFLKAVKVWPHANPSDLWWFVVYRAYCDPYNHPARFARLDLTQSWKRTGGWALEEILVRHYGPFLSQHSVRMFIASGATKYEMLRELKLGSRLEADKIDIVLTGDHKGRQRFFGVVHVKASFAERRTDDVPMSVALLSHRLTSPLWTMDCKSMPSALPVNRGELGGANPGERSAKRKDIEDEGYFSGCFSYNANTIPSPNSLPAERRVHVCDFSNPDDVFSRFILKRWRAFRSS